MEFKDILRSLRRKARLTQAELADALGLSRSSISMYERGEREPDFETIELIADYFNVSMGYLVGWEEDPYDYEKDEDGRLASIPTDIFEHLAEIYQNDASSIWAAYLSMQKSAQNEAQSVPNHDIFPYKPTHRIPILGRISAGLPLYAEEHIEGYMMTELNGGGEYFALRVKGDSMTAARIYDGDLIIVRRQDYVENGQLAVVLVNGYDATVKKFYRTDTTVSLVPQSLNPEHQMQVYDASKTEIKVLGLVVQIVINV